jgi:pantoate--beta-alanine ligase
MLQAATRAQVRTITSGWQREDLKTALVPTMGNLHDGHLTLVDAARREADRVIASIYVNPTQFGQGEDFDNYPRTLAQDCARLDQAGCDLVFLPDQNTMYPYGLENQVKVLAAPDLTTCLEGQSRPGHFDGVTTVVARLFNVVRPDYAVFGEKDYQQLLVIRRMVDDLGFGIQVVAVPTMRERTGLAMSSRNNYLEPRERKAAGALFGELSDAARQIESGTQNLERVEMDAKANLEHLGFSVQYLAVRNAANLIKPQPQDRQLRVLAAATMGRTRLIDNVSANRVGIA